MKKEAMARGPRLANRTGWVSQKSTSDSQQDRGFQLDCTEGQRGNLFYIRASMHFAGWGGNLSKENAGLMNP